MSGKMFLGWTQPEPYLVPVTTDDPVCGTIVRIPRIIRDTKMPGWPMWW
ncbi:MAG: hypothetical protein AB7T38_07475 [Nitrospirales bacterium]